MFRKANARPVYFTASPINSGSTVSNLGNNKRLNDYAVALKTFAAEKDAPFADQFHQLIDVWGRNKPNEGLANAMVGIRTLAQNDKLEGVEHLREFLAIQGRNKVQPVSMMGDPVHPGPTGQLTMAAALLKDLGAEPFVSSLVLDATGKVVAAKACKVEASKGDAGAIAFTRLDDCLPFPISDDARPVLALFPTILDLSQYTLTVQGLTGNYTLAINGKVLGTVTAADLEKGINLTTFATGPIADQGKAVLAAGAAEEGVVNQV